MLVQKRPTSQQKGLVVYCEVQNDFEKELIEIQWMTNDLDIRSSCNWWKIPLKVISTSNTSWSQMNGLDMYIFRYASIFDFETIVKSRKHLLKYRLIFVLKLCTSNIKFLCYGYQISLPLTVKSGFANKSYRDFH